MQYRDNDIPKHKKKSTKTGKSRAKHKHEYIIVPVIINDFKYATTHTAQVCKLCGYIHDVYYGLLSSKTPQHNKFPMDDSKLYYININDKFIKTFNSKGE